MPDHRALEENNMNDNDEQVGSIKDAKNIAGFILLFLGVCIALWVFINAYSTFNNPSKLTMFQNLISNRLEATFSADDSVSKLVIPPEILAYFIPLIILSIAVGVAGIFVTGGIKLLDSDLHLLIRKFDTFKYQINNKLESFKNAINQKNKNL